MTMPKIPETLLDLIAGGKPNHPAIIVPMVPSSPMKPCGARWPNWRHSWKPLGFLGEIG